jgi:tyrosinase
VVAVRRNILGDSTARQNYIRAVKLLKQEFLGPSTSDFGIAGPSRQVSTYDLFVVWHHLAMFSFTPPTQQDRNAAHIAVPCSSRGIGSCSSSWSYSSSAC